MFFEVNFTSLVTSWFALCDSSSEPGVFSSKNLHSDKEAFGTSFGPLQSISVLSFSSSRIALEIAASASASRGPLTLFSESGTRFFP